jgi:hypothetical protein
MTHLTNTLRKYSFPDSTISRLANFKPRTGFRLVKEKEFAEMTNHFRKYLPPLSFIPLFADNANYLCVYVDGPLKGKICEWHHEECALAPMFRSVDSLLAAIESNPECDDWIDLPQDYPQPDDDTFTIEDEESLLLLHNIYNSVKSFKEDFEDENSEQNRKYVLRVQTAYCICALTPPKKITTLIPFLDDDDMFVQEQAIWTFGEHRYRPVLQKIQELLTTAKSNGRIAAKGALLKMEQH